MIPAKNLTDELVHTFGHYGADFASLIDMPSGLYFNAVIADSGSPLGSLTIKASGDVVEV